ncbi:MAG: glycoside hydrolase family 32 protein, partial [Anaerolineae bacterium]
MTHTTLPPMPARDSLTGDIHRPQFHFLPPANWMNDPNGIIQENGRLHLFYQYNPEGAWHGNIHWGHAVTTDLVHWSDLPIALAPGPDGPDAEGCWSGCAVDDQGIPTLVYTSASPQTVSLATSTDELVTWTKHAGNPVIAGPPFELAKRAEGNFRDPFVWRQDGSWYLIIGSKIMDVGGTILLYRSQDLVHWDYLHPLLIGDVHGAEPFWTGTMWECPLFLDFGARQALVTSVQATRVDHLYPAYATGSFQDERFTLEVQDILAHGGYFYAPHTGRLEDGRHVMWGWLREARSPQVSQWAGWAGTMSLPLIVSLEPDGQLALAPAAELQALRDEHRAGPILVIGQPAFERLRHPLDLRFRRHVGGRVPIQIEEAVGRVGLRIARFGGADVQRVKRAVQRRDDFVVRGPINQIIRQL